MKRTDYDLLDRLAARLFTAVIFALALLASMPARGGVGDTRFFGVLKGQDWLQTNSGPAVPDGPSSFQFRAFLEQGLEGVTNQQLFLPGGVEIPLEVMGGENGGGTAEARRSFPSSGELDTAFPNGTYSVVLSSVFDGQVTNQLGLAGNLYPGVPTLINYSSLQAVDPGAGLTLVWNPISGATTNDFIQLQLVDCNGEPVFESPPPGRPGYLPGTATSMQIPPRRLRPGRKYGIEIMAVRFSSFDTNTLPGVASVAGYFAKTRAWLVTLGTPTDCAPGYFELMFQFPFYSLGSSTQGVVSFPQNLAFYVANFSLDGRYTGSFPPQVRFTGPGGFGWSNETNYAGHIDSTFAWYGSRSVNVPAFPPGGIYTVSFASTNLSFNLLDPRADQQQILLVPTAIVDASGLLNEIRWVYHATNGAVVGPQPFMDEIGVRVEMAGGGFYDSMNHGVRLAPGQSAHVLSELIPWSSVTRLQLGFRDLAGNQFVSHWERGGGHELRILSSELPPGRVGSGYEFTLTGDGGVPPRHWELQGGNLPEAVTLNPDTGFLSGVPAAPGAYPFVVRLVDSQSNSVAREMVLVVESNGGPEVGTEPNLRDLIVAKGLDFVQTNAVGAVPAARSSAIFRASVSFQGPTSVTNILLRLPGGSTQPLNSSGSGGDGEMAIENRFASTTELDTAFPNGTYDFLMQTANDGPLTNSVTVTGNAYPPTPRINNFAAAQSVNPTNDFLLSWDPLTGLTTNDVLFLEFRDCYDRTIFGTPGPGEPGALNGTSTNFVIPARTLRPGQSYRVELTVARLTTKAPTEPPGGRKFAGYLKQLKFSLATMGVRDVCPEGDLRLVFMFRPGVFNGLTGTATFPEDVASYSVQYSIQRPPNPPLAVRFSGPPGSGLVNAEPAYSGGDDHWLWFGSPSVNTPPYPPGGIYSVLFDGEPKPHHLLDPRVGVQKVLLVPNVVTNDAGEVTALNWTYRDVTGAIVPPPGFMRRLQVRLFGANGPLWEDHGQGGELRPPTTNQVIDPPVAWADVVTVQTGFADAAGNEFLADWLRGTMQVQITTFALPGTTVSNVYQAVLSAFGGTPPYQWAVVGGNLPSGLRLDAQTGVISGTPLEVGRFEFAVRVSDSGEQADEHVFVIGVRPPGPDVASYLVAKGRLFAQTNALPPTPAEPGFQFVSFVDAAQPGGVQDASVEPPSGLIRTLTGEMDRFRFEESFANQVDLDAAFANGVYRFALTTVHDGTPNPALLLTNNLYPSAPRVANWLAAQAIDADHPFLLAWDPFPGGTTNDLIVLGLARENGEEVFGTPSFLEPGYLDGTRTNAFIPQGVLTPGARHRGRVLFVRRSGFDTNSYPGVLGIAAYFAQTEFGLGTANPAGLIEFGGVTFRVNEEGGVIRVPVVRLGGTNGNVAVEFSIIGGSAGLGTDFALTEGVLEFPAGVATNSIVIEINNDDLPEPPETIRLALGGVEGGADLGRLREAEVVIADDDRPPGANVEFYVVAKGQAARQTGPASMVADDESPYFFGAFTRAAFPGGLNQAAVVSPAGVTNDLPEDEGSGRHFEFFTGFPSKTALDAEFARGLYTFLLDTATDGSRAPTLNLPADAYPNAPRLSNWPAAQAINAFADFVLTWDAMTGGTADDFVRVQIRDTNTFETLFETPDLLEPGALNGTATSVVIPGGLLTPSQGYACEILFFNVAVANAAGYPGAKGLGGYARQTRTLITTATPPPPGGQIQFAEPIFTASETNGTATITLVRLGGSEGEVSVVVASTNGSATAGADFTAVSTTVVFANGQTNAQFEVAILDDSTFEGPETVRLGLRSVSGTAALAGQTNALLTLLDNELPPTPGTIQFTLSTLNTPEGVGVVNLTVVRTGGSAGEVTVDYETADGSALDGEDYLGDFGTVVFAPGITSRTIPIEIIPDAIDESNEVFTVTLSNPSNGATLGERQSVTVGIADDDVGGVIAFSAPEYRVNEAGFEAAISLRRTGGSAEGASVDYAATGDSATEDLDFEATTGTVTFEAGETEKTLVIPILDDDLPEGNELLRLALSNATGGATLGRITNASLTIIDDEVIVQFARVSLTNSEAGPQVLLTVNRTGPVTEAVSVDYATGDESAVAGEDYTETAGTLTIAAGATSRTILIPILNDGLVEEDETFTVSLFNPEGAQLGEAETATVLIVDNDEGGTLSFVSTTVNARENSPVAVLTVTRSGGRASGVSVDFSVTDGSATDGEDYVSTNGTLNFPEGVTRLTIAVPILDDALDEETETFTVQLSNATGGAVLGENTEATVNIADNDVAGTVRFAATSFSASETGGVAVVTLLRSGGKAGGVTVDFTTGTGSAVEGEDYTETSGTVTFEANETSKTFEIPLLTDGVPDGNKTLSLLLSNPGGGARLQSPTNATLNIIDEVSSVQFASATYSVSEAGRNVILTVVRSGPPGTVSVTYATASGTATSPGDYRPKTGVLTFSGTATSKIVSIPILNDTAAEENETFTVTLSSPTGGAQLGPRDTATVTITDNDLPRRNRR